MEFRISQPHPQGLVIFAHGNGRSRHNRRNQSVAHVLQSLGFATLLFDLLPQQEEILDRRTAQFRFDIGLLAGRLIGEWNIGQLFRQKYASDCRNIGFTTYARTVTATSGSDSPGERKKIRSARRDSFEGLFHQTGLLRSSSRSPHTDQEGQAYDSTAVEI